MTHKLKRPVAFLSAFAMVMAMLLYLPIGTFTNLGLGLKASAVNYEEEDYCKCTEKNGVYEPNSDGTHTQWCENCGGVIAWGYCTEFDESGICTVCQGMCVHNNVVGDFCNTCGKQLSFTGTDCITFTAIYGSPAGNANEGYANLTDGNTGTKWCCDFDSGTGACVVIEASEPVKVSGYVIATCEGTYKETEKNPTNWTLSACSDYDETTNTGTWTIIDEVAEGGLPSADKLYKTFTLSSLPENPEGHKYFKLDITGVKSGNTMQISEFTIIGDHIWGAPDEIDPTCTEGGYIYEECVNCNAERITYTGDPATGHSYNNGFCEICGGYEPATLTKNKYDIDGDEKIDEVYEIGNAGQLYWFAGLVNGTLTDGTSQNTAANAVLTANIIVNKGENTNYVANCNGIKADGWKDWTPIGNDSNMYTGTFNGINHTVSGLYFNDEDTCAVGLFGCLGNTKDEEGNVTSYAKISSISVSDSYIKGYSAVGGISGYNHYGFIINCNYKGTVIGNEYTGGVCGYNNIGLIIYCYNRGTVSGGEYIGGVCGGNNYVISNCCNRGKVSGEDNVGGVCGGNNTIITNCYNIGTVSAESEEACIGGVGGYNHGIIANCYYNSDVYSGDAVGVNDNTVSENVLGKNTNQFTSGEVAYLLSQGCTIGEGKEASTYDGSVWGQTLTGDNKQDYPVLGGKMVLTNSDQSKFANDIIVYGQSATLDGMIGMNVYVAADDNYTGWTASFNGTEVTIPEKDENGLYKFTYQIAAKDMEQEIVFSINGEEKAKVTVKAYLEGLKASSESGSQTEETVKLVELVKSMETYGNAASAFFGNGTVAEVTGVADNACESFEFTKASEQDVPAGISYYGSSLLLKSETTVRHYFQLEEGKNIENFAFTVKVGDAEYSTVTPVEKQDYYYIDIENISADQLDTPHTVKIGDVEVISNYSAMSYVNSVLSSETADDNLKNLVKTLYLYNQKANAVSGAQSSN